jgi:hypothetical protein
MCFDMPHTVKDSTTQIRVNTPWKERERETEKEKERESKHFHAQLTNKKSSSIFKMKNPR